MAAGGIPTHQLRATSITKLMSGASSRGGQSEHRTTKQALLEETFATTRWQMRIWGRAAHLCCPSARDSSGRAPHASARARCGCKALHFHPHQHPAHPLCEKAWSASTQATDSWEASAHKAWRRWPICANDCPGPLQSLSSGLPLLADGGKL